MPSTDTPQLLFERDLDTAERMKLLRGRSLARGAMLSINLRCHFRWVMPGAPHGPEPSCWAAELRRAYAGDPPHDVWRCDGDGWHRRRELCDCTEDA